MEKIIFDTFWLSIKMYCKRYIKSSYRPQLANNAIETYIFQTKMEIDEFKLPKNYNNLNNQEWHALQSLRKRPDITIKKADKNNTIVIMNTASYIKQGRSHLNSIHFEYIDHPNTPTIIQKVNSLRENLYITNK